MCKFKLPQLARKHAKEQAEPADRRLDIFDKVLLLHFSLNLSETFRIDVNIDFAKKLEADFLSRSPKKCSAQNLKKTRQNGILRYGHFCGFFRG